MRKGRFDLIGSGNEKFEPVGAQYVAPYSDRQRWGNFNHLFNASYALTTLQGRLGVIPRLRAGGGERGIEDEERITYLAFLHEPFSTQYFWYV